MSIPIIDIRVKRSRARPSRAFLVGVAALLAVFMGSGPAHAEISQKLKDALVSSSPKVRIVAVSGVAKTKDPQARILLESMLKDPDAAVRAAVVEGLGRVGDPAAVPALQALSSDGDATVQAVLKRVLPGLEAQRINIYLAGAEDFSGKGGAGAAKLFAETKKALEKKLGPGFVIHDDKTKKGYGANPLAIRSVGQHQEDGNSFVDVKCELTLVEMPGNILRAALSSTASAGVGGKISAKLEQELVGDAVNACAPELADDFASYVKERAGRR